MGLFARGKADKLASYNNDRISGAHKSPWATCCSFAPANDNWNNNNYKLDHSRQSSPVQSHRRRLETIDVIQIARIIPLIGQLAGSPPTRMGKFRSDGGDGGGGGQTVTV